MRRIAVVTLVSVAALAALAACREERPAVSDDRTAPAAPAATPAAAAAPAAPVSKAQQIAGNLAAQLVAEKAHRSTVAVPVERVVDALAGAGVALDGTKQVLALTVGAAYCLNGRTPAGLSVSTCEYPDRASLDAGVALTERKFPMPDRVRLVEGTTMVTFTTRADTADDERAVTAAVAAL